jgi:hypothetical protein
MQMSIAHPPGLAKLGAVSEGPALSACRQLRNVPDMPSTNAFRCFKTSPETIRLVGASAKMERHVDVHIRIPPSEAGVFASALRGPQKRRVLGVLSQGLLQSQPAFHWLPN